MSIPPGLALNALQIITQSMTSLNVLASGEVPTAAEASDSLNTLNQMIDSWQAQRLTIFAISRQVFALTLGQQVYQMGLGAPDFNVPRPAKIDRVSIINLNNAVQPLELPIDYVTDTQWQQIPTKNILSALPQEVWDDQQFPYRNLSFWPIPSQAPLQTAIYSWVALNQFPNLTTTFQFPPAYARAIRFNLAIDLFPEFGPPGQPLPPAVAALAVESKSVVEQLNAAVAIVDLRCDPALTTSESSLYNYITDMPVRRG